MSKGLQLLAGMCQQVKIALFAGLRAEMDEIEVNVNSQFRKVVAASVCVGGGALFMTRSSLADGQ